MPQYPATKYMGSKQSLLPFITAHIKRLHFKTALDAFSGSGCVAYALKQLGAQVYANDFMRFCYHTARATIENNATTLGRKELTRLLAENKRAQSFVRETYSEVFFDYEDCEFLDNLWANLGRLEGALKRSIALAAASRACMKKRPRGIFTFVGKKGWDGRNDLKITMKEQFVVAVKLFNEAVFSNGKRNRAFCNDVFDLDPRMADLIYIDTPYLSPFSDCDYTRRYHFVEGYNVYWGGLKVIPETKTRKFSSYKTSFSSKDTAIEAFRKLFDHFRKAKLAVSYSSNSIPDKRCMVRLLKEVKKRVSVYEAPHKYSHGNHRFRINDNNNNVLEYLFVAE